MELPVSAEVLEHLQREEPHAVLVAFATADHELELLAQDARTLHIDKTLIERENEQDGTAMPRV